MKKSVAISAGIGFFILAWAFQNCSQGIVRRADINVIDQSSTEETSGSSSTTPSSSGNSNNSNNSSPLPATTPTPISSSSTSCFTDYVSIFPWSNSNDDIRDVALQMSQMKLGTVKIYTGQYPVTPSQGSGWYVSFLIEPVAGTQSTTTGSFFEKPASAALDRSMSCQLGPKDTTQLLLSRLVMNFSYTLTLNGYVGATEKFMACKSNNSDMPVTIRSADGHDIKLQAGQAFVLKRGCYP